MFGTRDCRCRTEVIDRGRPTLVVTSDDCPGEGRLAARAACRATVTDALGGTGALLVRTECDGLARTYAEGVGLLHAAARFAERVHPHDAALAERARHEPVVAARRATGRAGPVGELVAATGLAEYTSPGGERGPEADARDLVGADASDTVEADASDTVEADASDPVEPDGLDAAGANTHDGGGRDTDRAPCARLLRPDRAPTIALGRVCPRLPERLRLRDRWEVASGGVVRRYETSESRDLLHLRPASAGFDDADRRTLAAAYERLASGRVPGPDDAARGSAPDAPDPTPGRAVRAVTDRPDPQLAETLRRHTRGLGYLSDLLAVPGATDATVAAETPVRVAVDGERLTTNVRLSPSDAATLASRVRATSGRGLSRAEPTGHATLDDVRVAAVTRPATDGPRFALRATRDETPWTLPRLVERGTLTPRAGATLSLAVERGVAALIAGPRGAGKTTLLGAALFALPPAVPTVVIEDTPELPVDRLRAADREVTRLAIGESLTATEAVRTALRLGDGALVVGEVRGEEAAALYEAMRVGSAADTTLGTIHGENALSVRERVVSDLGVPESAFAATDLVVTLDATRTVDAVTEVRGRESVSFAPLFDRTRDAAAGTAVADTADTPLAGDAAAGTRATGVIDRGESHLLETLARPTETYADVRDALTARTDRLRTLAAAGVTDPGAIHTTEVDGG